MNHLSEETLNEYLDNALAPSTRADVDAHLALCAACAAELAGLRSLFTTVEALPEVPLRRDLAPGVVARIAVRAGVPRSVRWVLLLQALAVIVSLGLIWPLLDLSALQMPIVLPDVPGVLAQFATGSMLWLRSIPLPDLTNSFSLHLNPSAFLLTLTLISACLLWLVGNGLLLVLPRTSSFTRRNL